MNITMLLPLILIPLCGLFNHLGGQSTVIPAPRFVCRMFGQALAFGTVAFFSGMALQQAICLFLAAFAGLSFWAAWKNGPEFMSYTGVDSRDYTTPLYTPNIWFTQLCDKLIGVSQFTALTLAQCKNWGTLYGTFLGALLYPMYVILGYLLTPYAFYIGAGCLLQGLVYRLSGKIFGIQYGTYAAEYMWGTLIGASFAAILILHE